jgi:hypothetical protein
VLINGNTDRINVISERVELCDLDVGVQYITEKKPRLYSGLSWIFECVLAQVKSSLELVRTRGGYRYFVRTRGGYRYFFIEQIRFI